MTLPFIPAGILLPPAPRTVDEAIKWAEALNRAIASNQAGISFRIENMVQSGLAAERPTADGSRRFFFATDTNVLSFDDGAWNDINTGGTAIDGAGADTRIAFWTDSNTLSSDADLTFTLSGNVLDAGSINVPTAAGQYRIGAAAALSRDGSNYTKVTASDGITGLHVGNATDANNYYSNDGHIFRKKDNTLRLTITAAGSIVPGSAALATTATDGYLYITSCAGVPTGVPTTQTGRVAIQFDSTNNDLYVYNGAWKRFIEG